MKSSKAPSSSSGRRPWSPVPFALSGRGMSVIVMPCRVGDACASMRGVPRLRGEPSAQRPASRPGACREPAFEFAGRGSRRRRLDRGDARLGQHRKGDDRDLPEIDLAGCGARRLPASLRARTVRKPIDRPSSAPPRISASTSRARATPSDQPAAHEQARAHPRGSPARRRSARPGRAGTACGCRPAPRCASDSREGAGHRRTSRPRSTSPNRLA